MHTVLIVDDQFLVRQGLKQTLSEECRGIVISEAQSTGEASAQIKKKPWNVVILDITLPDKNGFQILQEIRSKRPTTRVLVLDEHNNHNHAMRSVEMGAAGYVTMGAGRTEMVRALKNVLDGKQSFDRSLLQGVMQDAATKQRALSARELKVMLAFAAGKRTGEIAAELKLSNKTISTYKRRILDKLALGSTADLVRYVIDHELL
jgi:two-component system, NarL family, invasion response regulator UvrY